MNPKRLDAVRDAINMAGLDLLCLVPGPSFFYLSGIHMKTSERVTLLLLPAQGAPVLVAPVLEAGRLAAETGVGAVYTYADGEHPDAALGRAVDSWEGAPLTVGVEPSSMRLLEADCWRRVIPEVQLLDASHHVGSCRLLKDPAEIRSLEQAVQVTEQALGDALELLRPGSSEWEIHAAVATGMLAHGASAYFVSVASGARSADPHGGSSNRVLESGDLVWIDCGACVEGYWADITRSFPVESIDDQLAEVFYTVYEAQREARRQVRPGMTCGEVDDICRSHITARGYGSYFIHRTGHGLGIEIHEPPYIVADSTQVLQPGMVFTIEPGIYLPGRGGVRIEDDMLVTGSGCQSLTSFERNFVL